jgi:hypothetical protein
MPLDEGLRLAYEAFLVTEHLAAPRLPALLHA